MADSRERKSSLFSPTESKFIFTQVCKQYYLKSVTVILYPFTPSAPTP